MGEGSLISVALGTTPSDSLHIIYLFFSKFGFELLEAAKTTHLVMCDLDVNEFANANLID